MERERVRWSKRNSCCWTWFKCSINWIECVSMTGVRFIRNDVFNVQQPDVAVGLSNSGKPFHESDLINTLCMFNSKTLYLLADNIIAIAPWSKTPHQRNHEFNPKWFRTGENVKPQYILIHFRVFWSARFGRCHMCQSHRVLCILYVLNRGALNKSS